jgi:hypothetical protein
VSSSDFWIFREQRQQVSGAKLVDEMRTLTRLALSGLADTELAADAVIRAGSLECGLADANARSTEQAARLTDALALNLIQPNDAELKRVLIDLEHLEVPQTVVVSLPEGFSYYALHPCDFSDIAESLPQAESYAVVGIRSPGATLSAMVGANLRLLGRRAERITVRPMGHPYNRALQLSVEERRWVLGQDYKDSRFVIVDEGPGRSGSTFLSVVDALVAAGIRREQIVLIGSHLPNPSSLCANNARERWHGLNFLAAKRWVCRNYPNLCYLGGSEWRKFFISRNEQDWPACWPQMERLKFLSTDGAHIFKFEGLSTEGEHARSRARCLAVAGLGPQFDATENGFIKYRRIAGSPCRGSGITRATLERLAEYCAFRSRKFRAHSANSTFADMANFNLSLEFGNQVRLDASALQTDLPVVTDSRMHPHEWIHDERGALIKTDGVSHGDDHFFPGPTDIAWDLAGAVIEWRLPTQAAEQLLAFYRRQTGDDVGSRFLDYKIAYAIFRVAWCRMALPTTTGTLDETKLQGEISRYRDLVSKFLFSHVTVGREQTRIAA